MVHGKKRVAFSDDVTERRIDDDNDVNNEDEAEAGPSQPFGKKFKHTLDSDEEDDETESEKYNLDNDLEGEEDGIARQEEDIKITPFNMKEELEEGHIDKSGMYIFHKKKDQVKDNWLDHIDSVKIVEKKSDETLKKEQDDDEATKSEKQFDPIQCYKDMLSLMQEHETVQKAIQRLGKRSKETKDPADKEVMMKLISLADSMIDAGDMDIYGRTVSQLQYKLKEATKETMDIFAEDEASTSQGAKVESDKVLWQFKWEDKEDAQVHGPYSNEQMIKWNDSGYFEKGVFVRQSDKKDAPFYSSKRIDFELYS